MSYHARQLYAPWFFVRTWWQWRHWDETWQRRTLVTWAITCAFVMLDEADREWKEPAHA